MRLSSLFLTGLVSLFFVHGAVWLIFRRQKSLWPIPFKMAIYAAGSYFVFARIVSIEAIRRGGEGQMIIYFLGFPSIILGVVLGPIVEPLGRTAEFISLIVLLMINATLLGSIVWAAGSLFTASTRKVPMWSRLNNSKKWGITFAVWHFLIISFIFAMLRGERALEIIRIIDFPIALIALLFQIEPYYESTAVFLLSHVLIGSIIYGFVGFLVRQLISLIARNRTTQ